MAINKRRRFSKFLSQKLIDILVENPKTLGAQDIAKLKLISVLLECVNSNASPIAQTTVDSISNILIKRFEKLKLEFKTTKSKKFTLAPIDLIIFLADQSKDIMEEYQAELTSFSTSTRGDNMYVVSIYQINSLYRSEILKNLKSHTTYMNMFLDLLNIKLVTSAKGPMVEYRIICSLNTQERIELN